MIKLGDITSENDLNYTLKEFNGDKHGVEWIGKFEQCAEGLSEGEKI